MKKSVIDKLYERYQGSPAFSFDVLLEMIEDQISNLQLLREDEASTSVFDQEEINISLPTIRITEDFGKVGTKDRAMIEKFARNIGGNTLEEKLANLNSVLTEKKEGATVGEILSTMVMAEMLYAILTSFTESAGGFIFEGFLAGLFGDKSVQIYGPEDIEGMTAAGKPITDVVLGDKHYSLKLLGQTTGVKGSFKNMIDHFRTVPHIYYLDARRVDKDQGLEFGEFLITLENFLDVFVKPFLKGVSSKAVRVESAEQLQDFMATLRSEEKAVKGIQFARPGFVPGTGGRTFHFSPTRGDDLQEQLDIQPGTVRASKGGLDPNEWSQLLQRVVDAEAEELQKYAPYTIAFADTKFEGTKAEKLFGHYSLIEDIAQAIKEDDKEKILFFLSKTPGYRGKQQFEFTRQQAEAIGNFKHVGTLMIGEQYMKATWARYADLLKETIGPVYRQLQAFTDNVNNYFLGVAEEEDQQGRTVYAQDAIDDAQKLQVVTTNAVQTLESTKQEDPPV